VMTFWGLNLARHYFGVVLGAFLLGYFCWKKCYCCGHSQNSYHQYLPTTSPCVDYLLNLLGYMCLIGVSVSHCLFLLKLPWSSASITSTTSTVSTVSTAGTDVLLVFLVLLLLLVS